VLGKDEKKKKIRTKIRDGKRVGCDVLVFPTWGRPGLKREGRAIGEDLDNQPKKKKKNTKKKKKKPPTNKDNNTRGGRHPKRE